MTQINASTTVQAADTLKSIRKRLFASLLTEFDMVTPAQSIGRATHDLFSLSYTISQLCDPDWLNQKQVTVSIELGP